MGSDRHGGAPQAEAVGQRRSRRVKALARLSPVLEMVGAAGKGFSGLHEDLDVRALAEEAMTVVVDHMGISESYGASRGDVVERVAIAAAAMRPGDDDAALRIAEWVVEWLCNERDGGRARRMRFADPARGWEPADLDVTLLYQDQSPVTGEFVLRASDEAINALLVAFDHDLADAQVAAEAVMKVHIESGNLNRASAAAKQAADASVGYSQRLRSVLERTRRDVTSVDWSDTVPAMLDEAHRHLSGRVAAEQQLLASAEEMRDQQGDAATRQATGELVTVVDQCMRRHVDLLNDLMPARHTFLEEQRRQQLEVVAAPTTVAVGAELLIPLLAAPIKEAAGPLDRFVEGAVGPELPRQHSLALLVDQLLRPRRAHNQRPGAGPVSLADLEAPGDEDGFSDAQRAAAADLVAVDTPERLSALVVRARERDVPDDLVALMVGAGFAFGREGYRTSNDRSPLHDERFGGDDLLVDPVDRQEDEQ
jgi:hypothetical protein